MFSGDYMYSCIFVISVVVDKGSATNRRSENVKRRVGSPGPAGPDFLSPAPPFICTHKYSS